MSKLIKNDKGKENRLTLVEGTEFKKVVGIKTKMLKTYAIFICSCGKEITTSLYDVKVGKSRSCGCIGREKAIARIPDMIKGNTIHGHNRTRLHRIWTGINQRCYNKNSNIYHRYGGRGITNCDEWRYNFVAFRDWALANGYQDHLTIDRIDPEGNYEPSNCQWLTRSENTTRALKRRWSN